MEGISARRKRNQGRVRALQALRSERGGMINRQGRAALELESGPQSGKRVIEAKGLSKSWDGQLVVSGLDLRVMRGDRVALVGPNGVGKTTLRNALTGESAETQSIREDDAKGRHTTTFRALKRTTVGGWLIDTPGMRELQLSGTSDGIDELFDDVETLGLTAGASAPEDLVQGVIAACRARFEIQVEEVTTATESVVFKLPRVLERT